MPLVAVPCMQEPLQILFNLAALAGPFGLALQIFELGRKLGDDVIDAFEVLLRCIQSSQRDGPLLLVAGNSGSLFKEGTPFLRLETQDAVDQTLADHDVGAIAEAARRQELCYVLQPYALAVE